MAEQTARRSGTDWRDRVLMEPEVILEDRDLMRALVAANGERMGENVVDLRSIAMERLEARLDRLEDTHRTVIAAAYENLTGTNQIHRCVLRLLEATDLPSLLDMLPGDLLEIVRVDRMRLVLESAAPVAVPHPAVAAVQAGFVQDYATLGHDVPVRRVILRQGAGGDPRVFGEDAQWVRSEALLTLDLGPDRLPGMLAFAAADANEFRPGQGTELLTFFADAFERVLRRLLG